MPLISVSTMAYEKEIDNVSFTMAERISKQGKKRIAVVDFTDLKGNVTELGRFLAEEIAVSIMGRNPSFSTIDRTHLKSIMKEHKLSETGVIDPDTARKIGKIAGVDGLVTGTLTPFGDSIRITLKVLDTQSAEIIDAQRTNIAKTTAIEELLAVELTPANNNTAQPPKPKRKKTTLATVAEKKAGNGLTVKLKKCTRAGNNTKCNFIIVSEKDNFTNYLYKKSRVIDNEGNEFAAKILTLGDISTNRHNYISKVFPKGIPMKASVEFTGLTEESEYLALLEVHFHQGYVQFHDVEFSP
ncbi:MAG: FlgO family outer membrane protein [Cellvibrionaceae bacterium]